MSMLNKGNCTIHFHFKTGCSIGRTCRAVAGVLDRDVAFREIARLRPELALVPVRDVVAAAHGVAIFRTNFVVVAAACSTRTFLNNTFS